MGSGLWIEWPMVTYILCFCVSCSANVPTVHVYEAVIVGLLYAHRNCCSIMLEVFFSSTTNYVLWWVQQFIYVWGTKDWGNKYSSPYFTRCTIMVGWIVCCVPNQMTSNFFFPADKVWVAYYRLVMGFFSLEGSRRKYWCIHFHWWFYFSVLFMFSF